MLKSHTLQSLSALAPLLEEYISEFNFSERTSSQYMLSSMREGMSRNSTIVLSDSLESPTCIAWGLIHQSATLDEKIFVATLVFINKSARGNSSSIIEMADSIDIAARFYGCKATYGGEIEGHPAAGRMWEKSHFLKQETVWVKLL